MIIGLIVTIRNKSQPLQRYHHLPIQVSILMVNNNVTNLDEDGEEEQESLIHGGEIHTSVETDEEHQLDQEAGVDEDVGDPGAEPDHDTGAGRFFSGVDHS